MQRLSIKITSNAKTLSSYSGLHLFSDLISKFEIHALIGPLLPQNNVIAVFRAFKKSMPGFWDLLPGPNALIILTGLAMILFLKSSQDLRPQLPWVNS